ncbi:hypothetical protein [Prescottella agglutinans]|jgi:hypothetical protein|uniref:Uncharacterized protein n=1 Tax=Prescottella agglutinans TaxID=1644129 RepID=A0ABT6MJR5_9NOCA|nr:hypothetical protein [Prescottella agglutinans]MDH6284563.1 hypothetical protein [Prescottella agglutinans]
MSTIKELESRLFKLYETPDADLEIETTSMEVIAAILRQEIPTATHMLLDWSCSGPHHEVADITAADGTSLMDEVDGSNDAENAMVYATNLRGAIADCFEPINPRGGVYRVELARF